LPHLENVTQKTTGLPVKMETGGQRGGNREGKTGGCKAKPGPLQEGVKKEKNTHSQRVCKNNRL
jgi:hypothetical protein